MTHLMLELDSLHDGGGLVSLVPPALLSWHTGVVGEQVVGQELAMLPAQWRVLHAVPAGSAGADIDHLVIGPGGVFVLNTKHHAAKTISVGTHVVWVNGHQESNYQRELLRRCNQVKRVLGEALLEREYVVPMLVFVRPKGVSLRGEQTVKAVRSDGLVRYLLSLPTVLAPATVDTLASRAATPSTWGAAESVLDEPDLTMRFLTLKTFASTAPPRSAHRTTTRVRRVSRRLEGRPVVRRLVGLVAALGLSLLVLPAVIALILNLFSLYLRALSGS